MQGAGNHARAKTKLRLRQDQASTPLAVAIEYWPRMIEDMEDAQRQSEQTPETPGLLGKKEARTPLESRAKMVDTTRFFLQHGNDIAAPSAKKLDAQDPNPDEFEYNQRTKHHGLGG